MTQYTDMRMSCSVTETAGDLMKFQLYFVADYHPTYMQELAQLDS